MKNVFKSPKTYMVAGLAVVVVTASAWQFKDKKQPRDTSANNYADADTTKPRKHGNDTADYGIKDPDKDGYRHYDDGINIDINLDGLDSSIEKTVTEALSAVDVNAIVNQAMQSVKQIDWNEINRTINESLRQAQTELKNIDVDKIKLEIERAQKEINSEEIRNTLDSTHLKEIIRDALRNAQVSLDGQRRI